MRGSVFYSDFGVKSQNCRVKMCMPLRCDSTVAHRTARLRCLRGIRLRLIEPLNTFSAHCQFNLRISSVSESPSSMRTSSTHFIICHFSGLHTYRLKACNYCIACVVGHRQDPHYGVDSHDICGRTIIDTASRGPLVGDNIDLSP